MRSGHSAQACRFLSMDAVVNAAAFGAFANSGGGDRHGQRQRVRRYGRFGGKAGVEAFTELRWITVQATPRHYPF